MNSSRKTGTSLKESVQRRVRGRATTGGKEPRPQGRELPSWGTECPFERGWGAEAG